MKKVWVGVCCGLASLLCIGCNFLNPLAPYTRNEMLALSKYLVVPGTKITRVNVIAYSAFDKAQFISIRFELPDNISFEDFESMELKLYEAKGWKMYMHSDNGINLWHTPHFAVDWIDHGSFVVGEFRVDMSSSYQYLKTILPAA